MKNFFAVSFIALAMMACAGGQKPESTEETVVDAQEATMVTVGDFNEKAGELVGKLVTIKGTADHICKEDGKKLFLIDIETEGRVKVVTGEDVPAFNSEYDGFDFVVSGIVEETVIDEAYLLEWEEEIKAGIEEEKHLGGGRPMTAEEKEAGQHMPDPAFEQVNNYRQMMADQGVDKLSFYSIVATSYEVIEE